MMADIRAGMEIIARFPELKKLPVFVDECDIAVGTPYGVYDNPNYIIHNSEFYPNFVCALSKRVLDLSDKYGGTIDRITAWAFYYDGKRYFEGNRTLVDNENIEKPILSAFRMLAHLGKTRLGLQSNRSRDVFAAQAPKIEVDGLASLDENKVSVLVWHQADEWWSEADEAAVDLQIDHIPFEGKCALRHYRIDQNHSNAYREWERLGSPQHPTSAQIDQIKSRMGLELLEPEKMVEIHSNRQLKLQLSLPLFGTSLVELMLVTK
jgi:xylan 1,4-beta-xylosidase